MTTRTSFSDIFRYSLICRNRYFSAEFTNVEGDFDVYMLVEILVMAMLDGYKYCDDVIIATYEGEL